MASEPLVILGYMMNFACFFITYDDINGFLVVKALLQREKRPEVNKYGITTILASPEYW